MITVIRLSPGGVDQYGDPIDGAESTHEIEGVIAPRMSADVDGHGRAGVVVGLDLFSPDPNADLLRTDLIEYRNERWEIDGEVGVFESPYGNAVDGLTAALKRGEG